MSENNDKLPLCPKHRVNKNVIDVSAVFQTYLTFFGDAERTAVAMGLDPQTVRDLAQAENWHKKVAELNSIRAGDSRDVQVQINRAINFVQAHRIRSVLDKIVSHFAAMEAQELVDKLTTTAKNGSETFSARALTDLVKALETTQLMTQRALGDTVAERPEAEPERKGSSIALQVMEAMSAADSTGLDSVALVRQQLNPPLALPPDAGR